jgi:hypothetical protein
MIKHRFMSIREKIDHDRRLQATKPATATAENHMGSSIELAPNVRLQSRYANRHGLITGATGSGKTVTLQTLAEGFSKIGVPVFLADVKGDIARLATGSAPVQFLDCYGALGSFLRVPIAAMGPMMLSKALGLSQVQSAVVDIAFSYADAKRLPLQSIKEFRCVLNLLCRDRNSISATLGGVSAASVAVIYRSLLRLGSASAIFDGPGFDPVSLLATRDGKGLISILAAEQLIRTPDVYATVLLWLLSDLFDRLPEVGDLDRPRLVFVFDESHAIFDNCPQALLQRIEQIIRLVRSKGVGVYFATQSPNDIPSMIAGQLGNRIQHALRAATGKDQKEIRAAADTMPTNPNLNTGAIIGSMSPGTALASMIGANGMPQPCELAQINLPACVLGAISAEQRGGHYVAVKPKTELTFKNWGLAIVVLGIGWAGALLMISGVAAVTFYVARLAWRLAT